MAFIDPCVSSKAQSCTGVWQAGEGGIAALRCRVGQDQPGQGLVPTEPPFWYRDCSSRGAPSLTLLLQQVHAAAHIPAVTKAAMH